MYAYTHTCIRTQEDEDEEDEGEDDEEDSSSEDTDNQQEGELDSDDEPLTALIKCVKCGEQAETAASGEMLLCDFVAGGGQVCNAGWHINCLIGKHKIDAKPDGKWYCPIHNK